MTNHQITVIAIIFVTKIVFSFLYLFNKKKKFKQAKENDNISKGKNFYIFIKCVLVDALEKFHKSCRLHILHSYLQHEKLKNKFKSLFELMITEENKPSLPEEFSIYRYKYERKIYYKIN